MESESGYLDVDRTCRDCGAVFTLEAGEQAFFARKSLPMPTRCKGCRAEARARRATGQAPRAMNRVVPPFRSW
jgi:hypothetical protein